MSELSKGRGIENYEVRQLLGKGGYACVYEGFDKTKKIEVAIKMIEKKKIKLGRLHERVIQEVAIHFRLKHPSVLELYDCFEDSNYVYLILELCHKGQMEQYLKSHSTTLTEDEARTFIRQVIDGIKYLHSHGIVHRDLTLANILLTKDMNVKISDFGMSTMLEDPNQKHYTLCGTPNYMSPEIVTRSAHGLETDVWSLGVLLYICLVGQRPFESDGVKDTLNRVAQGKYEIPDTLSPEARDLIQNMLRKKVEDRIFLQDILTHPFMRVKSTPVKITKMITDMSMDSGCVTISSTKHSSSSSGNNMYVPSRRNQPMPAFPLQQNESHREEDRSYMSVGSGSDESRSVAYFSQGSSLSDRHPPSPPVRERDSQSEEELRRTMAAMRYITYMSKPQNINSAMQAGAEVKPAAHRGQSRNEQYTAAAESTTSKPHVHSLQSNDRQKTERRCQAFDPCKYKDTDSSNYKDPFWPVQQTDRTHNSGNSLCEGQQLQQTSQHCSVDPANMQTQDLASKIYNFLAKSETQKRLQDSQPVELVFNELPMQFSSPEPATRKVKLTEKEIQRCFMGSKEAPPRSADKRASKELYSLGPPFNTQGITARRIIIRNTVVNFLESGGTVLEFIAKKGQVEAVVGVMTISSDGMQVTRYTPAGVVPVSDQPPPQPSQCETFVYPNIPEKLVKKYIFAAQLADILKAKLPKVTVFTRRAKCYIMENTNFCAEFYDGVKALSDGKSVKVKDTDGTRTSLILTSAELNPRLSRETLEMLEYVQQCRDLCIKVEQAISSVQSLVLGADRLFPATVGRRPGATPSSQTSITKVDHVKNKLRQNAVSEMTSLSSTVSQIPKTTASVSSSPDRSSAHVRLKTIQGSVPNSNIIKKSAGENAVFEESLSAKANETLNTTAFTATSWVSSSASSDSRSARAELPASDFRCQTFVPGVGWASQKTNGEMWMLFQDGTRLGLRTTTIMYFTDSGIYHEYKQGDDLPSVIRKKLGQMGEAVKTLGTKSNAASTSTLSSSLLSSSK